MTGQIHALIIDDNANNVSVLAQLLTKEGAKHTQVSHPNRLESALDNIGKVDVVFLDLEMPGKDGFEVRDLLRANPAFDGVPIVAYTVHISEIDTAYHQGFDGFIGKPLDPDKFPNQLARILRGEGVWETV
ncbi:MAG: response regulator [Anaerolineae bacterium]|jgi:two-component system cell cycle response regulator DivK|nr:MAG: response regulator [Anaerolineae bacterium]